MLAQLIREVVATFRDPRRFYREVLVARDHSLRVSATYTLLAIVLNMLQVAALLALAAPGLEEEIARLSGDIEPTTPTIDLSFREILAIIGAASAGQVVLLTVGGVVVGRFAGGRASLQEMAAAISWHALCAVIVSIAVSVAELLLGPNIGALIGIAAFALGFWVLASLIGAAQDFPRTGIVAVGIVASLGAFAMFAGVVIGVVGAMLGVG